jgi:predicted ABC-type transport system involved in lysophospholipase L1 biosynthesis ATPase subunit
MSEMQLTARDLRRSFQLGSRKIDVLRGITVDIAQGETVFLCGASGAGKTTLLYTLAGLEHPESGVVTFQGTDIYRASEGARARLRNDSFGFIFQGYFLLPELTALENATLPTMIHRRADTAKATRALERVGLGDRLHHLPAELSGGEQQRVAIARALMNDPKVIFADEPTGNLDSATGESIVALLLTAVRETQATLVVVTHDRSLAQRGDRTLEMRDGLLTSQPPPPLPIP